MTFSVKVSNYQKHPTLNICDSELIGKNISNKNCKVNISKNYYGEQIVNESEAENLLKNSAIINMVGNKTISLSLKLGIGTENGIKNIDGVPFLIVFKM